MSTYFAGTFNGSSYLNSTAAGLDLAGGSFWVAAWVNPTATSGNYTIACRDDFITGQRQFSVWIQSNHPFMDVENNSGGNYDVMDGNTVPTGSWSLLVFWHDASDSKGRASFNAQSPTVSSGTTTPAVVTTDTQIGCRKAGGGTGSFVLGDMDGVAIGKGYAPTSGDLTWLYNGGAGRSFSDWAANVPSLYSSCIAYYTFSDGSNLGADTLGSFSMTNLGVTQSSSGIVDAGSGISTASDGGSGVAHGVGQAIVIASASGSAVVSGSGASQSPAAAIPVDVLAPILILKRRWAGGPSPAAGTYFAGTFNGSSAYLNSTAAGLDVAGGSFWVAAWVNPLDTSGNYAIVARDDFGTGQRQFSVWISVTHPYMDVENNIGGRYDVLDLSVVPTGSWSLLVFWHNASDSKGRISFNAAAPTVSSGTTTPVAVTSDTQIGCRKAGGSTGAFFHGGLDGVAIGKGYAPTSGDITWLYNMGAGRSFSDWSANVPSLRSSCIAYYTFSNGFDLGEDLLGSFPMTNTSVTQSSSGIVDLGESLSTISDGGTAIVSGVGRSLAMATATASVLAVVLGVSSSLVPATASASGSAAVSGVGRAIALNSGVASDGGLGVASGVGLSLNPATATGSGVGAASGVSTWLFTSTASASGSSVVTGQALFVLGTGVGTASGQAATRIFATSGGSATAFAAGVASTSWAGYGFATGVASDAGLATATGSSNTVVLSVANDGGSAAASGVGIGPSAASDGGISVAGGVGHSLYRAIASAPGSAIVMAYDANWHGSGWLGADFNLF